MGIVLGCGPGEKEKEEEKEEDAFEVVATEKEVEPIQPQK